MRRATAANESREDFAGVVRTAKLRLLRMHHDARVGHIGGNLSALDAMLVLHHRVLGPDDSFVLAKGHAAGALYVSLWSIGKLADADLAQFHADGTKLAGHPAPGWNPAIPIATGSLGHGLPMAAGVALAKKLEQRPGRVFCLTSDGEWEEGSNWEAIVFARHQRLDRLTILVDANGLQGFGSLREVSSIEPLRDRFAGFGVRVEEIDGHDLEALGRTLSAPSDELRIVVLRTVKGKGVSFMENRFEWHYLPLDDDLYAQAVAEIERG